LSPTFKAIQNEFKSLGLTVKIKEKKKPIHTAIDSAFLKAESIWQEIVLEDIIKEAGVRSNKTLKIKIEVDRHPPLDFRTEEKLLLRPFSFYVKCFAPSSLFAGKVHALLLGSGKTESKEEIGMTSNGTSKKAFLWMYITSWQGPKTQKTGVRKRLPKNRSLHY
jgi:hypothetical protein